MKITCKVKETGRVFTPDIVDFDDKYVIEDASMEELEGLIGKYTFDEVELTYHGKLWQYKVL
jgi:hypothetical protein